MAPWQGVLLRGPVALPDDRGPALCLPPRDAEAGGESPASSRAARPRRVAAAHRRLPRVEAAHRFQPARHLQALSGTRRLAIRSRGPKLSSGDDHPPRVLREHAPRESILPELLIERRSHDREGLRVLLPEPDKFIDRADELPGLRGNS